MNPYGHPLSHPDALPISEVAYETSASDRGNPPVGAGRLRFLSTLWPWAFRILVLRLSSLWLLTLRLSNVRVWGVRAAMLRSEEHTSELQSLMRISYDVLCLKKKNNYKKNIKRIYM